MDIPSNDEILSVTEHLTDPVEIAIMKYENHPSIKEIQKHVNVINEFQFEKVDLSQIKNEIRVLYMKKSASKSSLPTKQVKDSIDIISKPLMDIWNFEVVDGSIFPTSLKLADVVPVHKKLAKAYKKNYRPVKIYSIFNSYSS